MRQRLSCGGALSRGYVQAWAPVVSRLAAEAAAAVRPALAARSGSGGGGYNMDPRAYVKIKRLAAAGSDSCCSTHHRISFN